MSRPSRKEFKRVRGAPEEKVATKENEVRIVASRGQRMYIKYAIEILTGAEGKAKNDAVILSGMGNAVFNVVNIAEILKRRVKGLHQTTEISSQTMTDKYEAVQEGKEGLTVERKVSVIEIVLSTAQLDKNHPGYQEPLPESEVTEQDDEKLAEKRERRPRKDSKKKPAGKGDKKDDKKGDKKDDKKKDDKKKDDKKKSEKKDDKKAPAKKGEKKDDERKPRAPRREGGRSEGGRGGRRDDAAPARGGRGGGRGGERGSSRGGRRDDREERAPRREGGRSEGGRGGRRDDAAPARGGRGGGRGGERGSSRGGRGAYSEGRAERGRR